MKITITYHTFEQYSPDGFENVTRIIHLDPTDTLQQSFEKITSKWKKPIQECNVELHFNELESK